MERKVVVIGGGLAGSEASLQLARLGVKVDLYEMRPVRKSPAHHTSDLAELVCSNSLGSIASHNASALLKEEMTLLDSQVLKIAFECSVPAGGALAVDRERFARSVTEAVECNPLITLHRQEMPAIDRDLVTIVASGPLTSDALASSIQELTGKQSMHFFDAASPILTGDSINMEIAFAASRYDQDDGAYINCPLSEAAYLRFHEALCAGQRVELKDFEKETPYFESCLPVEVIGSRDLDALRFGPMKPVGLVNPRTGEQPHAVVQLRQDDAAASLYNMVGFQTNLKWPEQQRIFKLIPGLEKAEFVRLGVMHRNTFIKSPIVLKRTLQTKACENVFIAGQLTGVEGYTESTAMGLIAAINAARLLNGAELIEMPRSTMIGALIRYITHTTMKNFQPINSNWGIIATPQDMVHYVRSRKHAEIARRSKDTFKEIFGAVASGCATPLAISE
jgi:methylenetetrahydrofolate--tRNA-(uracil-5-)-methyltransferase